MTPSLVAEIRGLDVRAGGRRLLHGIDLEIPAGVRLGLLGASGSGKSTLCRALAGFFPEPADWRADRFQLLGRSIGSGAPHHAWRGLRGAGVGLVLQDPKFALNPLMRVGDQIGEPLWGELGRRSPLLRERVLTLLAEVEVPDPERAYDLFPHQISGGMGQRVMIAMALLRSPPLILADEPTSALDASAKRQVLAILDRLVRARGAALVLVSHEVHMLARFCDEIVVMHDGSLVDRVPSAEVYASGAPQTRRLVAAAPRLEPLP